MSGTTCQSECDCDGPDTPGSTAHAADCYSRRVCGEDGYCDKHFEEAARENRWMLRSSFGAVTGRMSEQDEQDLRDAGRGHLVRS